MLGMLMNGECDAAIFANTKGMHQALYQSNAYLKQGGFISLDENICDLIQPTSKVYATLSDSQPINRKYANSFT